MLRPQRVPSGGVIWVHMAGAHVTHWNGKTIPKKLRELPPGTYMVEAVETAPALTAEDDQGLADALASLRVGEGLTVDQVRQTIDSIVRR